MAKYEGKNSSFALRLKQHRELCRLTQQQVADILNINRTTYTKYETGVSEPSHEVLRKIDCKKLFKNKILIGVSAGSMNMAIKGYYSNDKDYPKTWFYNGIGLVDITIDPHFDINNLEWVNENKKYSYIH